jgi:hypothetical protein
VIYWLLRSGTIITSIVDKELVEMALSRDSNGRCSNAAVCRQIVPTFAEGWRDSLDGPWRPLAELDQHYRIVGGFFVPVRLLPPAAAAS